MTLDRHQADRRKAYLLRADALAAPFRNRGRRAAAAGFSLLELLLVLVLLVVFAALAVPNLKGAFHRHRLQKGADAIRAEWTRARLSAIRTGKTHAFYYQPEAGGFYTVAHPSMDEWAEAQWGASEEGAAATAAELSQLPQGVVFAQLQLRDDPRSAHALLTGTAAPAAVPGAEPQGAAAWDGPLFFFPDGTSSAAQLVLANEFGWVVPLQLRGLTGRTGVGEVAAHLQDLQWPGAMLP